MDGRDDYHICYIPKKVYRANILCATGYLVYTDHLPTHTVVMLFCFILCNSSFNIMLQMPIHFCTRCIQNLWEVEIYCQTNLFINRQINTLEFLPT